MVNRNLRTIGESGKIDYELKSIKENTNVYLILDCWNNCNNVFIVCNTCRYCSLYQ